MEYGRIPRLRALAARVAGLFWFRKRDSDFDEEVQTHLRLLVDRFVAQGMSRRDASAGARRQIGSNTQFQEKQRKFRKVGSQKDVGRDLTHAPPPPRRA